MKLFEFLRKYLQGKEIVDSEGNFVRWSRLQEPMADIIIATAFVLLLILITTIALFIVKKIIYASMRAKVKKIEREQLKLDEINKSKSRSTKIKNINTYIVSEIKDDSPYKYVDVKKRAETISKTTYKIIASLVWVVMIIIILDVYGINIIPFITGAGIIGIAVAFGAQEFVKDFISGLFNIFENTYSVGESVVINGFTGTVREIGLRTTKIEDWTGDYLIINNGQITSVINRSRDTSTAIVDVMVSNACDVLEVETAIKRFIKDYDISNPNILGPLNYVGLSKTDITTYTFTVTATTPPASHKGVEREIRAKLVRFLELEGFEAPHRRIYIEKPADK